MKYIRAAFWCPAKDWWQHWIEGIAVLVLVAIAEAWDFTKPLLVIGAFAFIPLFTLFAFLISD